MTSQLPKSTRSSRCPLWSHRTLWANHSFQFTLYIFLVSYSLLLLLYYYLFARAEINLYSCFCWIIWLNYTRFFATRTRQLREFIFVFEFFFLYFFIFRNFGRIRFNFTNKRNRIIKKIRFVTKCHIECGLVSLSLIRLWLLLGRVSLYSVVSNFIEFPGFFFSCYKHIDSQKHQQRRIFFKI